MYLLGIISWLEGHQIPCPLKLLTGFDCPGCGIQRSLALLLKGDLANSFIMYPALLPIILLLGLLILHLAGKLKKGTIILKYSYIFCAGIIMLGYIYKLIFTKTQLLS